MTWGYAKSLFGLNLRLRHDICFFACRAHARLWLAMRAVVPVLFKLQGGSMRTFVSALRQSFRVAGLSLLLGFSSAAVVASPVNLGYLSYDTSGTTATFDIANITGANSVGLGDPTFPVITPVTLSGLSLLVHL